MSSFAEAFGAFLTDVGASLQEFVETVSTKPEPATTPAATVQAPARPAAPAPARAGNSTRVRLDVDVAHEGSAQALYNEFQDWARTHGQGTDARGLVAFLQQRQGVTPRSWSAVDYAGYGSAR